MLLAREIIWERNRVGALGAANMFVAGGVEVVAVEGGSMQQSMAVVLGKLAHNLRSRQARVKRTRLAIAAAVQADGVRVMHSALSKRMLPWMSSPQLRLGMEAGVVRVEEGRILAMLFKVVMVFWRMAWVAEAEVTEVRSLLAVLMRVTLLGERSRKLPLSPAVVPAEEVVHSTGAAGDVPKGTPSAGDVATWLLKML
jgi:hypothetical protein